MFGLMVVLGSSKFALPFYFISRYSEVTKGCGMLWFFFGTSHGKRKHNGVGIVVKQMMWAQQFNTHGHLMQNDEDAVNFLQVTRIGRTLCSYPIVVSYSRFKRVFWHVKVGDVDCDNEWAT
jgi:hypothetical protein